MTTAPPVLAPDVVAAIDDLELAARLVVEGMRAGGQRSPFHGFGAEFEQHRPYRAGDDIKYLDWKVYGRSGRLYTRQFRETTNVGVMLVLDSSASMAYPPAGASSGGSTGISTGISKFRYAVVLAAALAYLAVEQGNAVGLMTTVGGQLSYLPARSNRVHLRALLARLGELVPSGAWQPDLVVARAAELLARRGLLVVLSDFYDAEEATHRELRHVVRRGHDVTMLQLLAPGERALPFSGQREVEDLETGERRVVDAAAIGAEYREAVEAFVAQTRRFALEAGIDHALFTTDAPPDRALRDWLVRRGAGAR